MLDGKLSAEGKKLEASLQAAAAALVPKENGLVSVEVERQKEKKKRKASLGPSGLEAR